MTTTEPELRPQIRLEDLRADCGSCSGLCCVALAFTASGGFGFDKGAGDPCTHLQQDFRCGIHTVLRERGFPGCTVFDCQGAGQKVTQVIFGGRTWRDDLPDRDLAYATFQVVRALHELLWYLADAAARPAARGVRGELTAAYDEIDALTRAGAEEVMAVDLTAQRERVAPVLARASELVRADARGGRPLGRAARRARPGADLAGADLAGADLAGADLAGADLRGVDLRGALLIGADLRGADLAGADVRGADLRDADLSGADASLALFLTQFQVSAARGSSATALPSSLTTPAHWGR